jgi:hypothetical protein
MKKFLIVSIIVAALAAPVVAQVRLDIGIDIPKGIGAVLPSGVESSSDAADFLSKAFIPFPEAALYYQFNLGIVKLGAGIRAYTVILASVAWPNAYAELYLGPLVVEAQVGGGVFGYYAINTGGVETGKVFFPDLSAWLALGHKKIFRFGCGAMGIFLPDQSADTVPYIFYLGMKAAIPL